MSSPCAAAEFHEFLYCSVLAPDLPVLAASTLLAQARALNAQRQITGLLVFDGVRFCHHLEGPRLLAQSLIARITADPRHVQVQVLHQGPRSQRRYQRFEVGFAEPDEPDSIADLHRHAGAEAVARFLALQPRFDISA